MLARHLNYCQNLIRYHLGNWYNLVETHGRYLSQENALEMDDTCESLLHKNYFASSDPHHDISKQLVDITFV